MPVVWYARTFRPPREMLGKRLFLRFGAVDHHAKVWVNGTLIGEHVGGYTPFSFEVTDCVFDGENRIVVEALDDCRSGLQPSGKQSPKPGSYGCMYTRTTGIWQTVWLEAVPQRFVESMGVSVAAPSRRPWLDVKLDGHDGHTKGTLSATVWLEGTIVAEGRAPAARVARIPIDLKSPRLWIPEDPTLYDIEVALEEDGTLVDRVQGYFGLRSVEIRDGRVLINGRRIFQRLVLDQGYYPEGIYTAPSDEALRRDIEISKELGFNGARLHQKLFEPRFLYWADRLGYLVWGEFPSWGIDMSKPEARQNFISEWLEALRRDMHHPSIIGWCPFNETPRNQNRWLVKTVYEMTKMIDPTRLVIDTSGYVHIATDVYDSHDYDQDPRSFRNRHSKILRTGQPYRNYPEHDAEYEGQPVMVSEFGGTWWAHNQSGDEAWGYGDRPRTKEEFFERYGGLVGALLDNPRMVGFCYTQLYDIEQEVNGLYTYDRRPKFDPAEIRRITSRRAAYEEV